VSPGNLEVVQIFVSWIVTVPGFAAIVVFDERRLRGAALERSWPPSSRDAAIFGSWLFGSIYGIVGVLVHFASTRRNLSGVLVGIVAGATLLLADLAAQYGAALAIDWIGL
jgi:hypothetical protein